MLDLVGNPEDRFSRIAAHFVFFFVPLYCLRSYSIFSVISRQSHHSLCINSTLTNEKIDLNRGELGVIVVEHQIPNR